MVSIPSSRVVEAATRNPHVAGGPSSCDARHGGSGASPEGAAPTELSAAALTEAQGGSDLAFARLIRAHERCVYSLALRALGNAAEAEELAQDVFFQLYQDLGRIESMDHLLHWLRRTASHRVIDRIRQRDRRPSVRSLGEIECDVAAEAVDGAAEADPLLADRLRRHLADLPAIARLVLILRYQEDLDPGEIAQVLDLSRNTVKSHLRRSLERLRAELTEGQRL
jgi:RNA polymerase sigma-70 factor, ECF subfamily